jgi:chemotaxis protein MotB
MARTRARGRRGRGGHAEGHEDGERWLLTYADMITLLMALFMVLFSISSVNISKVQALQLSLRAAFSGDILPGGKAIAKPGATANASRAPSATDTQAIVPLTPRSSANLQKIAHTQTTVSSASTNTAAAQEEQSNFEHLKHELDAYAAQHGFANAVNTSVQARGLVIRVLTDRLLFSSGSATLIGAAYPLLGEIGALVNIDRTHPVSVEGNTDDVPIHGGEFPSNWELSTARASMVVRFLIGRGVDPQRLSASGYADLRPIASNATAAGRAENRRVEIVLRRMYGVTPGESAEAFGESSSTAGTSALPSSGGGEGP